MDNKYLPTESEKQEYLAYKTPEDVIANLQAGIQSLQEYPFAQLEGKYTLVCGGMAAFDKGVFHFLNRWNNKKEDLFLLSEVTAQYRRYTADHISFPYICTPHLLAKEMIVLYMNVDVTEQMESLYREKKYIREAIQNLEARHFSLGEGYAIAWSYYAYQYISLLLERLKPKKVILWNEFYAFHHIFKNVCQERNVPVSYMEFGCIPGTIALDHKGQQGESEVAWTSLKKKNPLSETELRGAGVVLDFLRKTGLNRNIQPDKPFDIETLHNYKKDQPVITFMGQNDYESNLYPYTRRTRKYHSPVFRSSDQAAKYIQDICVKTGWNYIYKPHPIMSSLGHQYSYCVDNEVTILDDVNINSLVDHSDVVITILSQSAYISLIRKTPVVMLGYTQLREKGCCYEAFRRIQIKYKIKKALKYGVTNRQRNMFRNHVAQMLNYNLYDDLTDREIRYGKQL